MVLQTGTKWSQGALCYMTGTKLTLVPAQKQPVLIERGPITLFPVVYILDALEFFLFNSTVVHH